MSILIKGMEMPKSCHECVGGYGGFCFVAPPESDANCPNKGRPDWCPLVEVPPHGRLIEKNAVFKLIQSMPSVDKLLPVEFMKALQEIPTVIEAEEGE